jgi:hypothetical protein
MSSTLDGLDLVITFLVFHVDFFLGKQLNQGRAGRACPDGLKKEGIKCRN